MGKPFTPLKVSAPVRRRPQPSTDKTRREERTTGLGLYRSESKSRNSPSPNPVTAPIEGTEERTRREVWSILLSGLHSLSLNDHNRPWPYPSRSRLRSLLAEFDPDLCLKAAREAKEIVQSQDRAPNITGLFEHRLRELDRVRQTIRDSLEAAG